MKLLIKTNSNQEKIVSKKILLSILTCSIVFVSNGYSEDFELPTTSTSVERAPRVSSSSSSSQSSSSTSRLNSSSSVNMNNVRINNSVKTKYSKLKNSDNGVKVKANRVKMNNVKINNKVEHSYSSVSSSDNGIYIGQ